MRAPLRTWVTSHPLPLSFFLFHTTPDHPTRRASLARAASASACRSNAAPTRRRCSHRSRMAAEPVAAAAAAAAGLLDLPDDLLIRCLAGAGGRGVGSAAATCSRLERCAARLQSLPCFSSALSTHPSLQTAIREAAQRALTGCFGAVDFALIFVAKYGSARGKKFDDPSDLRHSVDMLREVLCQDVPILGCACAGIMGTGGPESGAPLEVDPSANTAWGRRVAAARKAAGLPPPPTKGVAVLLGKLPAGSVARGLAFETLSGPTNGWKWPELTDALALTSSQRAALSQELQETAALQERQQALAGSNGIRSSTGTRPASAAAATPAAAAPASDTAPMTEAAQQLLQVASALDTSAAAGRGGPHLPQAWGGEVQLVPSLCLLLYQSHLHGSGQEDDEEEGGGMDGVLSFMSARGIKVVGGASSGEGHIFYSPGAAGRRLTDEPPPASPEVAMLMFCTARASTAALQDPDGEAAAATAGGAEPPPPPAAQAASTGQAGAAVPGPLPLPPAAAAPAAAAPPAEVVESRAVLTTSAVSAQGVGPVASLWTDVVASPWLAFAVEDTVGYGMTVTACRRVAAAAAGSSQAAAEAGGSSSSSQDAAAGQPVPRRSQRVAAAAAAALDGDADAAGTAAAGGAGAASSVHNSLLQFKHESDALESLGDLEDGVFVVLWRSPAPPGVPPEPFTGDAEKEPEFLLCETQLQAIRVEGAGPDGGPPQLHIPLIMHSRQRGELHALIHELEGPLCMQLVGVTSEGCATTLRHGLRHLLAPVWPPRAAAAASHSADCYAALARCAAGVGARSGLASLAAFICTGRGQALFTRGVRDEREAAAAFGSVSEAGIVDDVSGSSVPFVGVYVDGEVGPHVHDMCLGRMPEAAMQAYTAMYGLLGCQPGSSA